METKELLKKLSKEILDKVLHQFNFFKLMKLCDVIIFSGYK